MKKLLFIFLFKIYLFANAYLIAPDNFIDNEAYSFEIEATGKNVKIPDIKDIDGNIVQSLGSNRTITSINGDISTKIKKTFQIFPKKRFTIPSFRVEIDGKVFKTKKKIVNRISPHKTVSNNYKLELSIEKSSLYVGEETILKLKFKYRRDLQIVDLSLSVPNFNHIWMKQLKNSKNTQEGIYNVQELQFLIFPQKSGILNLPAMRIDAKILDNQSSSYTLFSPPTKDVKIYSNSLNLDVKALPNNISLIGEFILKSSISKKEVNEIEPVSFKININGYGNIEDIKDIKLNINNATIYENKPKVETKIEKKKNKFSYEKTFSILSDSDFVIPSIQLKYFDKNIGKIVVQKTQKYKIKVNKLIEKKAVVLQKAKITGNDNPSNLKEKIVYKNSLQDRVLFFVLGILVSLLIISLYFYVKNRNKIEKEDLPIVKLVKKSKTKNDLLKILVPYLAIDNSLDDIIFTLEKDKNINIKMIKKEIITILKSLKI